MTIIDRPALAPLTTLRLGGTALAGIRLDRAEDCERLQELLSSIGGAPCVIGGGSNLLIHDGLLPLTMLRPLFGSRLPDGSPAMPEIIGQEETEDGIRVLVRAGAGMPLPRLLAWSAGNGLAGLEGLVGIPGHVGGAVAMNAGSYGCSTAPLLRALTVYTPERGLHELAPGDWHAAYRHFSLASPCDWYMTVSAVFALRPDSSDRLKAVMAESLARKKSTQPVREHTAGCVFKNPEGESAGRLLDAAGMKGRRKGAMLFSTMHANFLVHDTACGVPGTSADALALIAEARKAVLDRFGIELQQEVKELPWHP